MKATSRDRDDATFDLTAMIDVVLLLIIFFMLTSHFARSEQAPMNLPSEKGEESAAESGRTVFLDLARDGSLSLRGRAVTLDEAGEAVQAAAAAEVKGVPGPIRVVVRADRDAPPAAFGRVCAVLSRAGIKTVSLGTSPEGAP